MPSLSDLHDHKRRIEEYCSRELESYIAEISDSPKAPRTKEFNDAVWGTTFLRPHEVVILDSPLLQRLRRVKQLGVVHFVYPAATHTRLEHSLGVVHQTQQMITSVNERGLSNPGESGPSEVIKPEMEQTLRLAALCHDIGHGFMSHVSEYALAGNRQCNDLQLLFQNERRRADTCQLSEMAAFYMIGSPAFSTLLAAAYDATRVPQPTNLVENMQQMILGMPLDNEALLLHEFISGPFDADKLDYLARDAYMCGVPNVTDIPRLIQKLRATRVDRERMPAPLKQGARDRPGGYIVTGIAASGSRTLDEIAIARTLLFDKVYRHQKVRTIEAMIFEIMRLICSLSDTHPAMLLYSLTDDELLTLDHNGIETAAGRQLGQEDQQTVETILDLSRRVRHRSLFARGFAFASTMTDDDYRHDHQQQDGLQRFLVDANSAEASERFLTEVRRLVVEILEAVGDPVPMPIDQLASYILLSPPKPAPRHQDTGNAQLIESDGKITRGSEDAAETTPWSDAYIATRDVGHLFCLPQLAPAVFIAAQTVLLEHYDVRIPSSMINYAKQKHDVLDDLRRRLEATGWFDGRSPELRARPAILSQADFPDRVRTIAEKLQGYWGPARSTDAARDLGPSGTVGKAQVENFVRQFAFGDDRLVGSALKVLEAIKLIGRVDVARAVRAFLDDEQEFHGASCAPLGTAKDSSAVLTYFLGDVAEEGGLAIGSVGEAVARDAPILFVDDFIGTGRQATDIVQAWMGAERTEGLDEEREELSDLLKEQLRNRPLAFVFAAGTRDGAQKLEQAAKAIGLDVKVRVGINEDDIPTLETVLEPGEREHFEEFVRQHATEALRHHNGKERDDDWIDQRVFGFGNKGLLLTGPFNTPTASLTVLWAAGPQWRPLLQRRTKR
ncbi:phosphoribosyltransferase-like protein [Nocardioides sp. SYSU DS0651]|uniref:phosphoribosyltransferase-like protein n=1 Tax=Nocardioides sp. SYSU DS0651 TaxID=3415955 RepID=UPI003F4C6D09